MAQFDSILAIINPAAGQRSFDEVKAGLEAHFAEEAVTIYRTTGEEDLPQVVRDYVKDADFDVVFAAGGDGTVSEVADGLCDFEVPMGIIPVGTSNALAREFGIPLDPQEALQAFVDGYKELVIDGIGVNGRYYLLHVNVGLYTKVLETPRDAKNRFGLLAYLWTLLKQLSGHSQEAYRLHIDGETHTLRAADILLANAGAVGILDLDWGSKIEPDDGSVHIRVARHRTWRDYLRLIGNMLGNQPEKDPLIRYFKAQEEIEVEVLSADSVSTSGDGESLGHTPLSATVHPNFLTLLIPDA